MGRRALSGDPRSAGVLAGFDPSGDARDHRCRRAADRGRHLCRTLSIAGAPARRRAHVHKYRRAGAADRADRLFDRAGAGQPDRAQLQARHLHQFRQSARSLRTGIAGGDAARRHSVRHYAVGARRPRRAARQHRPRLPRRYRVEDGQQGSDAAAARGAVVRSERRRDRDRGGRRASLRHGAERRTFGARRTAARGSHHRAGLQALCARHHAAETRHVARRGWRGIGNQTGTMGAVGGFIRKIRRRDPAAAVDRHCTLGRRARGQGFYCRAGSDRRRTGYFVVRRLAGVRGAEEARSSFRGARSREPGNR